MKNYITYLQPGGVITQESEKENQPSLWQQVKNKISSIFSGSKNNIDYFIAPELKKLNSSEIKELQQSYNLEPTGIIDKNLVNSLTKDMYKNLSHFNLSNPKSQTECAKYVNNQINQRIRQKSGLGKITAPLLGTYGNAWTINSKLGHTIFNLYDDKSIKNQDYNSNYGWRKDIENLNKNYQYDWSKLRIGDVIGLEYTSSPNHQKAAQEVGQPINTHVGFIAGYDNQGNPIVSHNIHGIVYNEPLTGQGKTHGGFVVSAYRPIYKKGGYFQYSNF